ncbi:hypothetical protein N2W54_002513 [Lotmaria passim]
MYHQVVSVARRSFHVGSPTTMLLQRKLTMSKRRLMMKQPHYCKTTTSGPLCVMLMSFVCYMIYRARYSSDDDRMFR